MYRHFNLHNNIKCLVHMNLRNQSNFVYRQIKCELSQYSVHRNELINSTDVLIRILCFLIHSFKFLQTHMII